MPAPSHPVATRIRRHLRPPAPFLGLGLGVVTVVLIHNPRALVPRPPYWPWLMIVVAVGLFGLTLQLGLEDGSDDEAEPFADRAMWWRAAGMAYLIGVLASITYLACVAVLDRLDGAAG